MSNSANTSGKPLQLLSVSAGAAFIIGIVIGIGIFRTPSLVASGVSSETLFIAAWLLGGLIMLVGALCYAELGSAHPDAGGEYHFLRRAFGKQIGVLFVWARGTVIQTGAIAAVAFVYADYASNIVPLGAYSSAIHAVIGVAALTALNLVGTPLGARAQVILTTLTIVALITVIVAGFSTAGATHPPVQAGSQWGTFGLAMVFVLLTYGGWNEVAYLSGELKDVRRNMVRTLLLGTAAVVVLYVLANLAYLNVFGLEGLRKSQTVGADLMRVVVGDWSAVVFSLIVCVCALSTLNATIFTGARAYYALGRDVPAVGKLGIWEERGDKPTNALLLQAAIALALVAFGSTTRDGFESMVAYTAPVFWFFLFLIALSVFVFRNRGIDLPYRLPLYPLPPILFGAAALWMIYSSIAYAGIGSIVGVVVLLAGLPLVLFARGSGTSTEAAE
ncbi:MAG: amino acid permease [Bradyrhizobiaceae bacterium]|nr:amino acid permease [Bradyrhizobiaceae bacterium]